MEGLYWIGRRQLIEALEMAVHRLEVALGDGAKQDETLQHLKKVLTDISNQQLDGQRGLPNLATDCVVGDFIEEDK